MYRSAFRMGFPRPGLSPPSEPDLRLREGMFPLVDAYASVSGRGRLGNEYIKFSRSVQ